MSEDIDFDIGLADDVVEDIDSENEEELERFLVASQASLRANNNNNNNNNNNSNNNNNDSQEIGEEPGLGQEENEKKEEQERIMRTILFNVVDLIDSDKDVNVDKVQICFEKKKTCFHSFFLLGRCSSHCDGCKEVH